MATTKLPPEAMAEELNQRAGVLTREAHQRAVATGGPVAIAQAGVVYHLLPDGTRVPVRKIDPPVRVKKGEKFRLQ